MTEQLRPSTPDPSRLVTQLRWLRAHAVVSTGLLILALWAAYQARQPQTHFGAIQVERIDLVEPDGTLRMVITSAGRFPRDHRQGEAGMLFFNRDGIENGGLMLGGTKKDGEVQQTVHLSMDRYDQDQTVVLRHMESDGKYFSGLKIQDRPERSLRSLIARATEIEATLPEGPARDQAMAAITAEAGPAPVRAVLGRGTDESAKLELADGEGRQRIRLRVTKDGEASQEFLDAAGGVVARYPESR